MEVGETIFAVYLLGPQHKRRGAVGMSLLMLTSTAVDEFGIDAHIFQISSLVQVILSQRL